MDEDFNQGKPPTQTCRLALRYVDCRQHLESLVLISTKECCLSLSLSLTHSFILCPTVEDPAVPLGLEDLFYYYDFVMGELYSRIMKNVLCKAFHIGG